MKHVVSKNIDLLNNFIQLKSDINVLRTNLGEKSVEKERKLMSQIYREQPPTEPQQAPDFEKKLESAIVLTGSRHLFECLAIGSQPFQINWSKNGVELVNSSNLTMSFNEKTGICQLILHEANLNDNALFSCKVSNDLGLAETSAYLKVKGK